MSQPPRYPAQPPCNRQTPPVSPHPQPPGGPYLQNQAFHSQPPQLSPAYPPSISQPSPQQSNPPAPKSNTTTGIIIALGVLLVVLTVAVVYLAISTTPNPAPSATPTSKQTAISATPGRGWNVNGNQLIGRTMTAQLPSGWQIGAENGAGNDGDLNDPKNQNMVTYWFSYPAEGDTDSVCRPRVERNRRNPDDPIQQIPGQIWGGKPALAYHMTVTNDQKKINLDFYCLDNKKGGVAILEAGGWEQHRESLHKDTQTLISTWQWK